MEEEEDHNSGELLDILFSGLIRCECEGWRCFIYCKKDVIVSYNNCSPNLTKVTADHSYRQRKMETEFYFEFNKMYCK